MPKAKIYMCQETPHDWRYRISEISISLKGKYCSQLYEIFDVMTGPESDDEIESANDASFDRNVIYGVNFNFLKKTVHFESECNRTLSITNEDVIKLVNKIHMIRKHMATTSDGMYEFFCHS